MVRWRDLIVYCMSEYNEKWEDVVSYVPDDGKWLDYLFDDTYGSIEGEPFTLWTKGRVYFPMVFDGSEWVASISRNPDGVITKHLGSW
jgi:hypothetical protein